MRRFRTWAVVLLVLVGVVAAAYPWVSRYRIEARLREAIDDSGRADAPAVIRELLDRGGDIRTVGDSGQTVATVAAWRNDADLLKRALDAGVNPNAADDFGSTALIAANFAPSVEPTRLLLAAGADPNHRRNDGSTPLMWAVRNARHDLIPLLLAAGAKVDVANAKGETPVSLARGLTYGGLWPMRPDLTADDFVRMLERPRKE